MSWSIGYYSGALKRELLGLPATLQARKTPPRERAIARRRMKEIKNAYA